MAPVALPPGTYTVQSVVNQYFLKDAEAGGQPLQLSEKLTPQWLITGDGIIKSLTHLGAYAKPQAAPAVGQNIIRAVPVPQTGWIINVIENNVGTHTGTIMTNDGTNLFWANDTTASRITLQKGNGTNVQDWTFAPSPPAATAAAAAAAA